MVQLVFDAPMATVDRQQLLRAGLCAALAADQTDLPSVNFHQRIDSIALGSVF